MPSKGPRVVTLEEEQEIIDDLHEGLALAVREHDRLGSDSLQYINETKLQKLIYLAIRNFDLPVTYSWYLAGAHISVNEVSVDSLKAHCHTINRNLYRDGELSVDDRPDITRRSNVGFSVEEYQKFFLEEVEDVWFTRLNEYLESFYQKYAPERYKTLYLRSLEMRELFNQLLLKAGSGQGQQTMLDKYVDGIITVSISSEFSHIIDDIELELVTHDTLQSTAEDFSRFGEELLNLIEHIENEGRGEISENERMLIDKANEFFFYQAWKQPCLRISRNTAKGPNKDYLLANVNNEIEVARKSYEAKLSQFMDLCRRNGVYVEGEVNSNSSSTREQL